MMFCDYKGAARYTLKMHIKSVHNKIKDHFCTICPYKTSSAHSLNIHTRNIHPHIETHDGRKPYEKGANHSTSSLQQSHTSNGESSNEFAMQFYSNFQMPF